MNTNPIIQSMMIFEQSPEFSRLNFQPSKYKDEHYHDKKAQLERSALYHQQTQK